ncbi:ubiquitin-ribosomal protein eL40 fusion protein-like [Centropristis striata]|uniref:ubiquitin-ribosomal protein eL40 fusion protein-like n=1 Tax=Centropristis striata TaxID=184440 RepID=UPI0027DF09CA|nr:ubiquitin-ribosomal protein eL40 fusion protein-like [Centropristis striata]
MKFQLNVVGPTGNDKIVNLCDTEEEMKLFTVEQLKTEITEQLDIDEDIRMVYGNKQLEESSLLISYGIQHLSTIHTVVKLPGGV